MSKNKSIYRLTHRVTAAGIAGLAGVLVGCGDAEIKTYRVAKDDQSSPKLHAHNDAPGRERPALPHLHSEVPPGWQELAPEKMRVASYQVTGGDGQLATVAVTPLPGATGIELDSVNMWREQELGLGTLSAAQLKEQAQEVEVGDAKGIMVDMQSEGGSSGGTRILGAVTARENITWFIKMTGTPALLGQQKANFVAYLKSLEFHSGSHGPARQVAAAADEPVSTNTEKVPAASGEPKFKAPESWKENAPGPMVTSAYTAGGEGGQAEVTISKFPGSTGGMVANINRWRDQLGLEALPEAEVRKSAEMIEVAGKKESYLVDIKGTNKRSGKAARMIAVGVPHGGQTWFFKLLGDEATVAKEKEAFVRFIVSAY